MEAWHFVKDDRTLGYDKRGVTVTPGLMLEVDETVIKPCQYGLHASVKALDALRYAPGSVICRVVLSGRMIEEEDKICASQRTVLWVADARKELRLFAAWCAEQQLYMFEEMYPNDARPRRAVEVAILFANGQATEEELGAARSAASSAASYAAYAASDAARSAASSAASDAARSAASSAARSAASSAARSAASVKQNEYLTNLLNSLRPEVKP